MPKSPVRWIFDTVVISNFALTDSLTLLEKRYQQKGMISQQVYGELLAGISLHPELKLINTVLLNRAFELISLSRQEMQACQKLLDFLGLGEASIIAYAHQNYCIVVTDDRAARNQCTHMNIPVTGTIGILKASVQDSLISFEEADKLLEKMISKGFYSPVRSISDIL